MIDIIFYAISTIITLFVLGFGLTILIIPKKLSNYALWLSPWFTIVFLIFFLTLFSLAGLSVKQASPFILGFLMCLNIYAIWIKKSRYILNIKEDTVIVILILISITLNLSPLIRREKMLTTVSMGNNDVIIYALVPDYLVHHSIFESFQKPVSVGISTLLQGGYRWGTPIISSFFLSHFNLQGYQFAYLFQVILFGLMIPLVYIFFKIIYKPSIKGLILSLMLTSFNVNLLYILYHDFFGQVLFWGIELLLLILIFTYFNNVQNNSTRFNFYDMSIGVTLAVLFMSYHEGVIFILVPLLLYLITQSFINKKIVFQWFSALKIAFVISITSSISIIRGINVSYIESFGANPNQPIGWQTFRSELPFANPFEALGLYSIHSFPPLPMIIALSLSTISFLIIIYGIIKIKYNIFLFSLFSFYLLLYIWFGVYQHHFWNYNRAITFTLPTVLIFFTIGIIELFKRRKLLLNYVIIFLIGLELFSGINLNKRFLREHITVDKSFISLKAISSISEPIYTEELLDPSTFYWKQIWTSYFLNGTNFHTALSQNTSPFENRVPDGKLLLLSKATPWTKPPQVLLNSISWENEYYLLGRLCNNSDCLLSRPEDLSGVFLGNVSYEDSLLITGWSRKENSSRWSQGKESTLRLVNKNGIFNELSFEAQTLKEPQNITVYFDGILLGTSQLSDQWKPYSFIVKDGISKGVHQIRFVYGYTYKPSEVLNIQDTRDLAVNFKWIKLQ